MSLLSVSFALFLALGLLLFHLSRPGWRPRVLLAISIAFYCTWNAPHVLLLLGATALVHRAALAIAGMEAGRSKLRTVSLVVTVLVVLLVVFKCALAVLEGIHAQALLGTFDAVVWLAAPLGLSYYFFKLIGYLLDVYWERLTPRQDFTSVALYASFFPQIVSGPIQRADDFFSQLDTLQPPDRDTVAIGLRRILFGLFKKIVVADPLALVVAQMYGDSSAHSSLELLAGAYMFSLQMYADFSGITDIAIGTGLLFGIRGPENFDRPYFARNIQEFWRRWHMSLSSWLADYLFMPLRMALRDWGSVGLAFALFVNMVAIGFWHGPRWSYVVFGCLNSLFIIVSVFTLKQRNAFFRSRPELSRVRAVLAPFITFHLVVLTHVFFRADDLGSALSYLGQMLHLTTHSAAPATRFDLTAPGLANGRLVLAFAGLVIMEAIHWIAAAPAYAQRFTAARSQWRWVAYYAAAVLVVMSAKGTTSFIYAKF